MRRLLIAVAIAAIAAPAFAAAPTETDKQARAKQIAEFQAHCQYQAQQAVQRGQPTGPMRLTDAPPARMERAVNRRIYGCPAPVIVRYDVEKK
ncbi:MAG: hypothetical protein JWR84_830 [Caulobacter sp.]|nr:hypothetical protein [Caulobacter sp.]